MADVRFTPHQQQAIDVRGGNVLVSAAAGSGKTAVLTERAIQLLTGDPPVPADRLVVVTFTVAAADEMKRRIGDKLSERIAADPENQWLQSQQFLLSSARICTIHSLCNALIQEHAQALGLSADAKISDAADLEAIRSEAVSEIMEEAYTAQEEPFLNLVEFYCVKNDRALCQLILSLYDFIRSFAFPLRYLTQVEELYAGRDTLSSSPWGSSVCAYLVSALGFCEKLLQDCIQEMRDDETIFPKYGPAFTSDCAQISRIREFALQGKLEEAGQAARGFQKEPLSSVSSRYHPDLTGTLKDRRKKVHTILEDLTRRFLSGSEMEYREDTAILLPHIRALFGLVRAVYQRIEDKKRERSRMDYADLEHLALSLLVEETSDGGWRRSERAQEIADGIDQIMIDECQDINEVQNLIFSLLSRNETNLYMVGDVKQSIYRFRKAMPGLFVEKKKRFGAYDPAAHQPDSQAVITLETNFRSRKEVCDTVNYAFSRLMTEQVGEIEYTREEALEAGACYPEYPDAAAEFHILDYDRSDDIQQAQAEARYIARKIRDMIDSGYQVARTPEEMRQCRYGDFAVLLRSYRSKAAVYEKELTAAGIPCFCDTSEGYFDSYAVVVMLNLLRVIDNPLRDIPLLSVLMSPMFGFSADQITEIRLAKRQVPFYTALLTRAQQGDPACLDFLDHLQRFRKTAATERIDTLLRSIYDQTDFLSIAGAMSGDNDQDGNLRLLLKYAQTYETIGSNGLSGFLRYMERAEETGGDFSASNVMSASADAVRILSIHKSKGLEFPICIVADCGKKFNKVDLNTNVQMNASLGFCMKINDPQTLRSYTSLPYEAIRLKTEQELVSEEMRVLYVAMTRAREKLILVATIPNASNRLRSLLTLYSAREQGKPSPYLVFRAQGYDEWLLSVFLFHPGFSEVRKQIGWTELLPEEESCALHGYLAKAGAATEEASVPERVLYEAPTPELLESLRKTLDFQYEFAPLTQVPAKITVTQIAKRSRAEHREDGRALRLNTRPAFLQRLSDRRGFTPAERGTILHRFMQFGDFAAARQDLDGEIDRLVAGKFLTEAEASVLNRPKIRAFLHSALYRRMEAADQLLREYKFIYELPAGAIAELPLPLRQEQVILQGIADCLLFEPAGITIVDYKTDYVEEPQILVERYYDQLRIYRDAIARAFDRPVRQCLIYSMHLEMEIEVPV